MGVTIEHFGCFGKLPLSREFLVEGARELSDSRFDRWIGEGLGMAKARLGPRFDEAVRTFPPYWFVWGCAGGRVLAGGLTPSEDAAGRKHPFAVYASFEARKAAAAGPLLPVWLRELEPALTGLLALASDSPTPAGILEAVRGQRASLSEPGRDQESEQARFLAGETTASLCSALFRDPNAPLRYQIFQAFAETISPLRGREARDVRIGVRFPVTPGDPERAAREAAFWLELTTRRFGRKLGGASYLWSSGGGAVPAALHLFLSEPSGPQWSCLVDPGADIETISFLDRPYGSEPERRMDSRLRQLVDTPQATLVDYLNWASG